MSPCSNVIWYMEDGDGHGRRGGNGRGDGRLGVLVLGSVLKVNVSDIER